MSFSMEAGVGIEPAYTALQTAIVLYKTKCYMCSRFHCRLGPKGYRPGNQATLC